LFACLTFTHAAPIPGLFNTGVDANKMPLPIGSVDPHYFTTQNSDPLTFQSTNAFVSEIVEMAWQPNTSRSQWIANTNRPATLANGYGVYRYTTFFDLTGFDPSTASITGRLVGDDGVYAVILNDVQKPQAWPPSIYQSPGTQYNVWTDFTVVGDFRPGLNKLEFEVRNVLGSQGIKVEMTSRVCLPPTAKPFIDTQPESLRVRVGNEARFKVAVDCGPVTFQWRHNGNNLPGQTQNELVLSSVTTTDAGVYDVVVTNANGDTPSAQAILTVDDPTPRLQIRKETETILKVEGLPQTQYQLEYRNGLGPDHSWQFLNAVYTSDEGFIEFSDTDAVNHVERYYRVVY
jgi:hypothetical protein